MVLALKVAWPSMLPKILSLAARTLMTMLLSHASVDLTIRFGGLAKSAQRRNVQQLPVINALSSTPGSRDVRVHDLSFKYNKDGCGGPYAVIQNTLAGGPKCKTPILEIDF